MIIFLYGPDSFRSRQKLDEIVQHYKGSQKSGLNLVALDVAKMEFSEVFDQLKVASMFAEAKLMILKNVFLNKSFGEALVDQATTIAKLSDVVVVYEPEAADERLKLFKVLVKEAKSQRFDLLDARGVRTWAQREFEQNGQKVNADALDLLVSYIGNDLWRLSNEVKKLSDFKRGAVVRKEDIQIQVKPKLEIDIFKTIDALSSRNRQQAFLFLRRHLDEGDNPLYLLSMVSYQLKNLLIVKELAEQGLMYASIVKKSGLHPFVVKKNYFMCQKFSLETLKKTYKNIFAIDSKIKTGQLEPETALDLLFSRI